MNEPRKAESQLVRVCNEGGTWDTDDSCPWDECNGKRHRLRRLLICSKCSQSYKLRKEFNSHECFDVS